MADLKLDIKKETDVKLKQWGIWARNSGIYCGFPNATPFRRLAGQQVGSAIISDVEGSEIDQAVSTLEEFDKDAKLFTVFYYVHGIDCHEMKSTKLKAGKSKAFQLKNIALSWVSAQLYR